MKQRVVIAIAMICNPELIICDEPTTALDVTIQAQIMELLKSMQMQEGKSIVLITHNMGLVAEMADEVCVMYMGRIVEFGTLEDILTELLIHIPKHCFGAFLFWGLQMDRSWRRFLVLHLIRQI